MAQQSGRLINQQSTWELNLTVLQRLDPHIQDILFTAAHVTLYDFDVDKCQWSRKDVEGSLFVVKRRAKPRFQFIVMNRRSTENLVQDVLDGFECEVQVPYLLYRNAAQEVNGIWFYNTQECEEVASLFSRISNAYSRTPPKRQVYSPPRDEFEELEAVPTSTTVEGPLEPTVAPAATVGPPKDSLERFFNNVLHVSSHEPLTSSTVWSPAAMHASPAHPSTGSVPTFSPALATPPPPPPPPPLPPSTNPMIREACNLTSEAPLKPYFYVPPPLPSSQPPTLHPPPALQPSVGAPLLQPFPPPTPFSLAPTSTLPARSVISKDGVRDALFRLVQSDTFIDMVFEEMLKAHRLPT